MSLGLGLRPSSWFFLGLTVFTIWAEAGLFEITVGGNYRRQNIDVDTYDQTTALTGAIAYYFSEMSSIELSYTSALNQRVMGDPETTGARFNTTYQAVGLDLIYTAGSRASTFRPYFKLGPLYILEKKIKYQYASNGGPLTDPLTTETPIGLVPSAGLGIKIALTNSLALKVGYEIWASRPLWAKDENGDTYPNQFDTAGRLAISWMF